MPDHLADLQRELQRVLIPLVFRAGPPAALADLSVAQIRCFYGIATNEGSKMNELGERLNVKLPALSHLVDRLVRRGLVERRADDRDRRVVRLHLSERARQIHEQSEQERRERLERTLAGIDPDQREGIIRSLGTLADAAERAVAAPPSSAMEAPAELARMAAARAGQSVSPKRRTGRQIQMSP